MKKSESHYFRILKLSIKICVEKLRCAAGHLRHFFFLKVDSENTSLLYFMKR